MTDRINLAELRVYVQQQAKHDSGDISMTERELLALIDAVEAAKAEHDWVSRMPDAGFNACSPRWQWWHERPAQARIALAGFDFGEPS